jgi:site-specific recombinase XerD
MPPPRNLMGLRQQYQNRPRTLNRSHPWTRSADTTGHYTPHIGRHTHAVTAPQRGVSLASQQRVLGHDNIETTAIYLNISGEEAAREYREKW